MKGPNGWLVIAPLLALCPAVASAQRYRVYEWETPADGWAEPTLQTYYVAKSDRRYEHFGESVRQRGVSAHTLEAEYGLTDRATAGVYADFDAAPGMGLNSWSTPSIRTAVMAAPSMELSSTRRRAVPTVEPNPRSNGDALNTP